MFFKVCLRKCASYRYAEGAAAFLSAGGVFCLCAALEPDERGELCPPAVLVDAAAGLLHHPRVSATRRTWMAHT